MKCRRTLQRLNSKEPYPSSERGRKFRRRLCTSSVQREIRPVSRRSRAVTAKKCTKKRDARAKLLLWLLNLFAFVTFSLPSPSSYLKVPINRGVRKLKGRRRRRKDHLKSESGPFHTSPLLTPSHSIRQLLAFVDLISKRLYLSLEEDKENFCYVFTSFKTREISKFQVVIVQRRQRKVLKA